MPRAKPKFNALAPLDRDALHRYLWDRSNPNGRIPVHQGELAEALGVTRGTVVRTLNEMVEEGRCRKVSSKLRNIRVFHVIEPEVWNGTKAPEPRRVRWG
jgi:predicted transcriptional regulator